MSSQNTARKAWNEAMKLTANASALPAALRPNNKRRSDRHRKQDRRTKARKANNTAQSQDDVDYMTALWVDALEGVDPAAIARGEDDDNNGNADDMDDAYDALEDLEEEAGKGRKKARRKAAPRKKKKVSGVLPKKFLPRTLASILLEEMNRDEESAANARAFLASEAKLPKHQQVPRRKFCPVTGLLGIYTEPKSGIPYASYRAVEQIRERPPPWMLLSGTAAYYEAVMSIEDEK